MSSDEDSDSRSETIEETTAEVLKLENSEDFVRKYPEMKHFMTESKSDIVFIVEGRRIPAIKELLIMKSPVMERMFLGEFAESETKEIEIKEMSYKAFKTMIRFIYCEQLMFSHKTDHSMAIEVFKCADRYGLERMKESVERKMTQMITIENIEEIYKFSEFYKLEKLIRSLKLFLNQNINHFLGKNSSDIHRINNSLDGILTEVLAENHQNMTLFLHKNIRKVVINGRSYYYSSTGCDYRCSVIRYKDKK